eukprot:TRINITY_DN48873_c0_g1_i1.p1 TRINITY_DN48873_c0_g1~~TRINITY_DN48873_c0_g1_i1.p1  ORF type:complete len:971 (-),score=271.45 TRINITY_DN48873_c0_g1_i1:157-3069(-)
MPLPIPFDWSEDENSLTFVLKARGVKAKNVSVVLCDVYVKVNIHPSFFDVDLSHEIDPDHPKTRCRVGSDKVTLTLKKKEPGIWSEFRIQGKTKEELKDRRQKALEDADAREKDRIQKKEDFKHEMIKHAEHEQWRKDSENRVQIENWEKEEKAEWEKQTFKDFDEDTGALVGEDDLPQKEAERRDDDFYEPGQDVPPPRTTHRVTLSKSSKPGNAVEVSEEEAAKIQEDKKLVKEDLIWTQQELDETEEYVPDVRENPGKIGIRFTERIRPGVPVRDRGGTRAPPFPKDAPKAEALPPMMAEDCRDEDETDPVWLKDKADSLMVSGDYQGAYNAYTQALKLAANARCFANRAVASLYLGNIEQSIEDCNSSIRILDLRTRAPNGHMPAPADPEDQKVRARVEIRMGVAYLWLGAFGKAEAHFEKALAAEDGLDAEETKQVKADLEQVRQSRSALATKELADAAARKAAGATAEKEEEIASTALGLYEEAAAADHESAVIHANRCFARLRAGQLHECLADADAALTLLRRWPLPNKPPKKPSRPARLDPIYLDDPTFVHPDKQKQGEVEWLMKHNGGSTKDLPGLPDEYEWVKDAAEKNENAWIAIPRKRPQAVIDAIRRATTALQDAMYTRKPYIIRQQVEVAVQENKAGEGPSSKAIKQAMEYADKLEEHEKEREAEMEAESARERREEEEFDLEDHLAPRRSGVAKAGLVGSHPVERTRRRLFVKVLLRRAKAHELLGQIEESKVDLRSVLRVEPENPEAKRRLADFKVKESAPSASSTAPAPSDEADATVMGPSPSSADPSSAPGASSVSGKVADDDSDGEEKEVDHASTQALLNSAAEYMKKNDYPSALEIYHYARNTIKSWETPLVELKVLSNTSLCLQRIRGRLPDLITSCNDTLRRISQLRRQDDSGVTEEMLLRMECAALSRRGSAYAQQKKPEQSAEDAARVKELLAQVEALEKAGATSS